MASGALVKNICLIPENTPSSHALPPSPPHGPGPHGDGSFITPQATYKATYNNIKNRINNNFIEKFSYKNYISCIGLMK